MIWYSSSVEDDPYRELWSRNEWLHPLENPDRRMFPLIITAEPTNACNLRCFYCSRNLMTRKVGFMSLETMRLIAREAEEHNSAVRHGGFGEPLFHPKIVDIVAIGKRHNNLTTIFSNCSFLTEDLMRAFVDLGLDEIRLSPSGITAEEHNQVRFRSDYDKDLDAKVEMARAVRDKVNEDRPFLTLCTNVMDYSTNTFTDNIEAYNRRYLQLVDKIDIDLILLSRVKHLDQVKDLYTQ